MELLTLWLWPLVALVVLPAMLVYFGLHVVGRGIIFVDLALAQIAALGIATAILLGADPDHSSLPYALAIAFTLAAPSLLFASGTAGHHLRPVAESKREAMRDHRATRRRFFNELEGRDRQAGDQGQELKQTSHGLDAAPIGDALQSHC